MPGPSNKRKGKTKSKRKSGNLPQQFPKNNATEPVSDDFEPIDGDVPLEPPEWVWHHSNLSSPPSSPSPPSLRTPPPIAFDLSDLKKELPELPHIGIGEDVSRTVEQVLLQDPFLYDPGNGPRVRDARAFMASFFARPPALEVSRSAELPAPGPECRGANPTLRRILYVQNSLKRRFIRCCPLSCRMRRLWWVADLPHCCFYVADQAM